VNTSSWEEEVERDVPRTVRLVVDVDVDGGAEVDVGREEEEEDIMRFWNSRCLFLSLSIG
jgi:hypothetical protein